MKSEDIIYSAGFLDGEGCITVCAPSRSLTPQVVVTNTNKEVLDFLASVWGGSVGTQRVVNPRCKPQFRIQWYGPSALRIVRATRPYLKVKTEQADLLLSYDWSVRDWDTREELKERMKALNKKGI